MRGIKTHKKYLALIQLKNNPLLMQLEKTNVPLIVFDIQQNLNLKLTSGFSFKSRGGLEEVKAVKSEFFSKKMHLADFPSLFHVATRRGLKAHRRHGSPRSDTEIGGRIYNAIKTSLSLPKKTI